LKFFDPILIHGIQLLESLSEIIYPHFSISLCLIYYYIIILMDTNASCLC